MITFFVPGVPVQQGSLKGFVARGKDGKARAIVTHANKPELKDWRATVRQEAAAHVTELFTGPVRVGVRFYMPRPASAPAWKVWPDVSPDLDKLDRGLLDAMTGTVFDDDKRVVAWGPIHDEVYALPGQPTGARVWVSSLVGVRPDELPNYEDDAKVGLLG